MRETAERKSRAANTEVFISQIAVYIGELWRPVANNGECSNSLSCANCHVASSIVRALIDCRSTDLLCACLGR